MEDKQQTASTPATEKRKRGRPPKQRTDPPKLKDYVPSQDQPAADPVPPDQIPAATIENRPDDSEPGEQVGDFLPDEYRTITITIPVVELGDGNEYQNSKNNPPKQIRTRPLTREQGIAIGSVRLGMIAAGLELESGRADFYSGGRRAVAIETKEQAIAKLLDMIAEALEKK